jgi:hypothetical protein
MKRRLFVAALALLVLAFGLGARVLAAPHGQDSRPIIAQPEQDAVVRGVVQVVGSATHPQFQRYELYYAPWPVPGDNSWIFIGPDAHFQQQPLGLLGTWDSRAVPDGAYALRVRVVKADANYIDSEPRKVTVANTTVVQSPTPETSETPTETPTATPPGPEATLPPPTAAAVATVPPSGRPTAGPTATSAAAGAVSAESTPIISGEDPNSLAGSASQIVDVSRLGNAAKTAATYTIGLFLAVGLFFGVKGMLYWLWQKIRP